MLNNFKDRIEKISFFLKNKNFDDAKYTVDQLISEHPNNVDFLNILGIIFLETEKKEILQINLNPGDMLIYNGVKLRHWREEFLGLNHAQVFLHYNDTQGDFKIEYDNRPQLGIPLKYQRS